MAYIYEGKTTTEAIEKGLKDLKVSKNQVEVKVLESEDKRSFFSILTPRVVKVELILKDKAEVRNNDKNENIKKSEKKMPTDESLQIALETVEKFLEKFVKQLPGKEFTYNVRIENKNILVDMDGEDRGYLIGYRGEVLNSLQQILNNIANRNTDEKTRVLLNIGGYKEKREKDLQNLAEKIAGTVIKTKKSITLEPMTSYERKIIHSKLQENPKVFTHSIGEEPNRRLVVSLKK